MKTNRAFILAAALLSAACGRETEEQQQAAPETEAATQDVPAIAAELADTSGELTGFWTGWIPGGVVLRMQLGESADGTVAGTGSLIAGNVTADFEVAGRHAAPDLELVLTQPDGQTATFSGKVSETTGWPEGTFTAFGGATFPVTLQRELPGS